MLCLYLRDRPHAVTGLLIADVFIVGFTFVSMFVEQMCVSTTEGLLGLLGKWVTMLINNRLVMACCDPRVQDLAVVAADMLALFDQFQGFAPSRRSPAGQSSDSTELLSAGRGLLPKEFARFVLAG